MSERGPKPTLRARPRPLLKAARLSAVIAQLTRKGLGYWAVVLALIVFGVELGQWLGTHETWINARYIIYEAIQNLTPQKRTIATYVVLIGDDEYWKGELARRTPIKRDYLAKLVRALDSANPAIIALDFDLRSPTVDRSIIDFEEYEPETTDLVSAINTAAHERSIVLPATVGWNEHHDYVRDPDIFDNYKLDGTRVKRGYIALPFDLRKVPVQLLVEGAELDSFSEAIVRAYDENLLSSLPEKDELPYGSYFPREAFHVMQGKDVLTATRDDLQGKLQGKLVLVGAGWHKFAYGRGDEVDSYFTPVGSIPGVFIHANYVEALLGTHTYRAWGPVTEECINIFVALVVALIFALDLRWNVKFAYVASLCLALFVVAYISWQNLGRFFDFFIPAILLGGHYAIEQIRHWHRDAAKYAKLVAQGAIHEEG